MPSGAELPPGRLSSLALQAARAPVCQTQALGRELLMFYQKLLRGALSVTTSSLLPNVFCLKLAEMGTFLHSDGWVEGSSQGRRQ